MLLIIIALILFIIDILIHLTGAAAARLPLSAVAGALLCIGILWPGIH